MLDLFTIVWDKADRHRGLAHLYCDATLPSLMQPGNLPEANSLVGSYSIYADDRSKEIITQSDYYREMEKLVSVSLLPLQNGVGDVNSNVMKQMEYSILQGNYMLIISPDWIIGNGSILNLSNICAEGKYQLILFGFPKIDPKVFRKIGARLRLGETLTNRELVSIGMAYGSEAMDVLYREGNRWIVSFRIPTPCLKPDKRVLDFFTTCTSPHQGYDHSLPMWMIEQGYSWQMIGHSDIFFLVEEAEPWRGSSNDWGLDLLSRADQFFRNYQQVWRGG